MFVFFCYHHVDTVENTLLWKKKNEETQKQNIKMGEGVWFFMSTLVLFSEIFKLIYLMSTWVLISPFQIFLLPTTSKLNFIEYQTIVYLVWVEIIFIKAIIFIYITQIPAYIKPVSGSTSCVCKTNQVSKFWVISCVF